MSRPIMIIIVLPCFISVIERHGIGYTQTSNGTFYIIWIFFKLKFRRMHTNNYKPMILIILMPFFYVRKRANAVNATIGPKINQNNMAFKFFNRERLAINPFLYVDKIRRHPIIVRKSVRIQSY